MNAKERLIAAYIELANGSDPDKINVTNLCRLADLNRSSFYHNFEDINDLARQFCVLMEQEFASLKLARNPENFTPLFVQIRKRKQAYQAYLKLGFNLNYEPPYQQLDDQTAYRLHFFIGGICRLIERWLHNDCDLSPEAMNELLRQEYAGRLLKSN